MINYSGDKISLQRPFVGICPPFLPVCSPYPTTPNLPNVYPPNTIGKIIIDSISCQYLSASCIWPKTRGTHLHGKWHYENMSPLEMTTWQSFKLTYQQSIQIVVLLMKLPITFKRSYICIFFLNINITYATSNANGDTFSWEATPWKYVPLPHHYQGVLSYNRS